MHKRVSAGGAFLGTSVSPLDVHMFSDDAQGEM